MKLRAGWRDEARTQAFYFDCAGCDAKEPLIAGCMADAPAESGALAFDKIGVISDGPRGPRHAVFCAECFARMISPPAASAAGNQQQEQQQTPMPQASTPTAPKTRTVLFTKELDRKNAVRFQEVPVEGQAPVCGTLYLQKWFCGSAQNVRVQVEVQ